MNTSPTPLAERMRPKRLHKLIGQEHLVSSGSVLSNIVAQGHIPSLLFWGPPGVGKTTLARIIANEINGVFFQLSAISSGVKEVREVIDEAQKITSAVLFVDEIHRFNKGQQDALLGAVEKGTISLIGATTENPSFEVNSALLSRCQVYILTPLQHKDLQAILQRAITEDTILKQKKIVLKETDALLQLAGGDARKLLNLLELVVLASKEDTIVITNEIVLTTAQAKILLYDKQGEQHYDIIAAFIKSMRGSDPNAAVYWLARMIEGGEDVKFIARRMIIFASEDIGLANPNALLTANIAFDAVHKIGYPESRIILAQCTIYLASSPKSNSAYNAINDAMMIAKKEGNLPVPLHLRNAPTNFMKSLDYGKAYQYPHQYEGNFVPQEYLPETIVGTKLYTPADNLREKELLIFLKEKWKEKYGY